MSVIIFSAVEAFIKTLAFRLNVIFWNHETNYSTQRKLTLLCCWMLLWYCIQHCHLQPHPCHLVFLCLLPSFKWWGQEVICSNPSCLSMMKLYWFLWMINIALCAAYGKPFVDGTELSLSISSCLSPHFPSFLHLSHDWLSKKSDSPQLTSASLLHYLINVCSLLQTLEETNTACRAKDKCDFKASHSDC